MFLHGPPRVWHCSMSSSVEGGSVCVSADESVLLSTCGESLQLWYSNCGDLALAASSEVVREEEDAVEYPIRQTSVWERSGRRVCILGKNGVLGIYALNRDGAKAASLLTAWDADPSTRQHGPESSASAANSPTQTFSVECKSITRRSDATIVAVCASAAARSPQEAPRRPTLLAASDGDAIFELNWAGELETAFTVHWNDSDGDRHRITTLLELGATSALAALRSDGCVGIFQWHEGATHVGFQPIGAEALDHRRATCIAKAPPEPMGQMDGQDTLVVGCDDGKVRVLKVQRAVLLGEASAQRPIGAAAGGMRSYSIGPLRAIRVGAAAVARGAADRADPILWLRVLDSPGGRWVLAAGQREVALLELGSGLVLWREPLLQRAGEQLGEGYSAESLSLLGVEASAVHKGIWLLAEAARASGSTNGAEEDAGGGSGREREVLVVGYNCIFGSTALGGASYPLSPYLLGNRVCHAAGSLDERPECAAWLPLAPPEAYLAAQAPLRICAVSDLLGRSGRHVAVAGAHGLALWHGRSRKWRLFPSVAQESAVRARALRWWGDLLLVLNEPRDGGARAPCELLVFRAGHLDHAARPLAPVPLWTRGSAGPRSARAFAAAALEPSFFDCRAFARDDGAACCLALVGSPAALWLLLLAEEPCASEDADVASLGSQASGASAGARVAGGRAALSVRVLYRGKMPKLPRLSVVSADAASEEERHAAVENPVTSLCIGGSDLGAERKFVELLARGLASHGLYRVRVPLPSREDGKKAGEAPSAALCAALPVSLVCPLPMSLPSAGACLDTAPSAPSPLSPLYVLYGAAGVALYCPRISERALSQRASGPQLQLPRGLAVSCFEAGVSPLCALPRAFALVGLRQAFGLRSYEVCVEQMPFLHELLRLVLTSRADGVALRPLAHGLVDALVLRADPVSQRALQGSLSLLLRTALESHAAGKAEAEALLGDALLLLRRFPERFHETVVHTARQLEPKPLRSLFPLRDGSGDVPFTLLDQCLRDGRLHTASLFLPLVSGETASATSMRLALLCGLRLMWEVLLRGGALERAVLLPQLWTFSRKREEALRSEQALLLREHHKEELRRAVRDLLAGAYRTAYASSAPAPPPSEADDGSGIGAAVWRAVTMPFAAVGTVAKILADDAKPPEPPPPPPPPSEEGSTSSLSAAPHAALPPRLAEAASEEVSSLTESSGRAPASLEESIASFLSPPPVALSAEASPSSFDKLWQPYDAVTAAAGTTAAEVLATYVAHCLEGRRFLEVVTLLEMYDQAPEVSADVFAALDAAGRRPAPPPSPRAGAENAFVVLLEALLIKHTSCLPFGADFRAAGRRRDSRDLGAAAAGAPGGEACWRERFLRTLFRAAVACGSDELAAVCSAMSRSRNALRQLLDGQSTAFAVSLASSLAIVETSIAAWVLGPEAPRAAGGFEGLRRVLRAHLAVQRAAKKAEEPPRAAAPPAAPPPAPMHSVSREEEAVAVSVIDLSSEEDAAPKPMELDEGQQKEILRTWNAPQAPPEAPPAAPPLQPLCAFRDDPQEGLDLLHFVEGFRDSALELCNRALERKRRRSLGADAEQR